MRGARLVLVELLDLASPKNIFSMVTTKLYLDARAIKPGAKAPIRVVLTKKGLRAFISTGVQVLPSQWDAVRQLVVGHPQKQLLNGALAARKVEVDECLRRMERDGRQVNLTTTQIKKLVEQELEPEEAPAPAKVERRGLLAMLDEMIETKEGGTRTLYEATRRRLLEFQPELAKVMMEDVTVKWLEGFDSFLARTSPSRNARNIHHRNIRAVFNRAIDEEVTTWYPFRRFKLRPAPTAKRSLSLRQLRKVALTPVPPELEEARDMWLLSFCLRGVNVADLAGLEDADDTGCVNFVRRKTHRVYSIKLEPEARAIIRRYKGAGGKLLNILDRYKHYRSWYMGFSRRLRRLKEFYNLLGDGIRIPELTSYWARHSWATLASDLDVPKETIAAGLGHGGHDVTDIYIRYDVRKVDRANRLVLDAVFGEGK